MFRKISFVTISAALALVFTAIAFGQTSPVGGTVTIKKSDNTTAPGAGLIVDAYRTDIDRGKMSTKTDKKGNFNFAGFLAGQTYVLVVSGPGISPTMQPNIKAGMEGIKIDASEGDGKTWTEEEVRKAVKDGQKASSGPATGGNSGTQELTEDQKKQKAEYEAQVKAVNAKNDEIKKKNDVVQKSLTDDNAAVQAKNYDLAVTKYTEGIDAEPNYVGSSPILLNNRGLVLKLRGIEEYNAGVKGDPAAKAGLVGKAKQDLTDSIASYQQSLTVIKNASAADIQNQAVVDKAKADALGGVTDSYRLVGAMGFAGDLLGDPAKAAECKDAFDGYAAIETDAAKKTKSQLTFGDVMLGAGDLEKAVAAYKAVLQTTPDNADALAGAGIGLISLSYTTNDKAQKQEAADLFQKFLAVAPADHKYRGDAEGYLTSLKNENIIPQKAAPKKRGN